MAPGYLLSAQFCRDLDIVLYGIPLCVLSNRGLYCNYIDRGNSHRRLTCNS